MKISHPKLLPIGSKRLLQVGDKASFFLHTSGLHSVHSRTSRGIVCAESGKQNWDLGRFLKTLYFFNGPPSPSKVKSLNHNQLAQKLSFFG